jgi:hypothetical protein
MIGGIEVFLPHCLAEAKKFVADAATTKGQPIVTFREKGEPEQTSKSAPAKEEHADKMLTPWEMELEMLEDWLNHPEPIDDCHEETTMQMIAEEHSEESLRIFSQGAEQTITAVPRRATKDEGEFQSEEQLEFNHHKGKWHKQVCQRR